MYRQYRSSIMAANQPLKVLLFLGTVRENRLGLRVAKFMQNMLETTNHDVTLIDPLEWDVGPLVKPLHFYKDRSQAPKALVDINQQILDADAFVMVSAEYNHSIPPALANLIDHFPGSSFAYRPSGIVCYSPGIYGGMRAAMQLRCFLGEIGCISVSNIFGIPKVHEALSEDGKPQDTHMESGAMKLISQLDWNAHAMRNHKAAVGIPK